MSKQLRFSIFITVLFLTLLTPLHAQAGQAPDAATAKISELVHAGRYAEAQQLTAGLLIAYPDDQRLIRAKALIEQLMTQPASAPVQAAAQTQSAPLAGEQLTGMDKVDYNALLDLVRQAQQSTDLTEQTTLLTQFMQQSDGFVQRHPSLPLLWQLRAASAITLNEPMMGYEAGHKLLALGAADSNDPGMQSLLGKLKNMGWLNMQQAETLQASADATAKAEHERAESVKYTFPVLHLHGISYAYGHLTINEDEAIYVGSDESFHIARKDVRDLTVACNVDACGFYINPKSGRRYYILAVTEDAVASQSTKGKTFLKPAVLGNAFVARWHFVKKEGKDKDKVLVPGPEGAAVQTPAAETPAVTEVGSFGGAKQSHTLLAKSAVSNSAASATPSAEAVIAVPTAPPVTTTISASSTATLYVYRTHQVSGMGKKAEIDIDGKTVAKLGNDEVVRLEVSAGKHNISATEAHLKADPLYDFEMEAGKTYWIHSGFTNGLVTHLKLSVMPAEQAETETKPLKEISAADTAKKK